MHMCSSCERLKRYVLVNVYMHILYMYTLILPCSVAVDAGITVFSTYSRQQEIECMDGIQLVYAYTCCINYPVV